MVAGSDLYTTQLKAAVKLFTSMFIMHPSRNITIQYKPCLFSFTVALTPEIKLISC